jgi:DNA (cytosine-5)-methyltransferase 1
VGYQVKPFKYISLFSGIEAASVAVKAAGLDWELMALCENDPELRKFLSKKYPNANLLPDIQLVNFSEYRPNLVVGGSPCQDFSVAGKRAGITGERSWLFMEFIRVVKETRADYFVWENVVSPEAEEAAAIIQRELKNHETAKFKLDSLAFNGLMRRRRMFVIGARIGISGITTGVHKNTSGQNRRINRCFEVALTRSGNKNRYQINTIPCLTKDGNKRFLVVKTKKGFQTYCLKPRIYEILFGLPMDYTRELGSNFKRLMGLGNSFDVNIMGRIFEAINDSFNAH